jgi:hypothetical protein
LALAAAAAAAVGGSSEMKLLSCIHNLRDTLNTFSPTAYMPFRKIRSLWKAALCSPVSV